MSVVCGKCEKRVPRLYYCNACSSFYCVECAGTDTWDADERGMRCLCPECSIEARVAALGRLVVHRNGDFAVYGPKP